MMVYEQNRKSAFFPPFPKRIVPALPFSEDFVFFFIISGLLTYVKSTNVKFGKMVIIGRKKISALQMMIYSEIIRQLMIERGLNQEKLARALGVNQTTVGQWLHGKKKPSYDNILAFYTHFGVTPNEFFGVE